MLGSLRSPLVTGGGEFTDSSLDYTKDIVDRGGIDVDCFSVDPTNVENPDPNNIVDPFAVEEVNATLFWNETSSTPSSGWNESSPVLNEDDSIPTITALHLAAQNGNCEVVKFLCMGLNFEGETEGQEPCKVRRRECGNYVSKDILN
ncbi:hypothetical protein TL16_g05893 [Triparma laevis f. inornata]|uniref:Uncharacterized protein n=1 Tax=Triparma laevis f. inornata TaxID=1714386 RepID=A0A9W7AK25_9STRA|nr:hypothetical protein TL16_g05893 [Triparma laevis f. inornata]